MNENDLYIYTPETKQLILECCPDLFFTIIDAAFVN